ncbi:transcription factor GTE5, chloroplastic-like [Quercus lobata]|uniref:Bromo domain-containing protein n=1 Tax=Quercus lobata TaxID=97700 RepID=A0A7N2MXG2_QUELO|nr:transcription factor GTE5, chloroplastic-like [Quercus lobata]
MALGALGDDEARDKKRPWEDGDKLYSRKTPKKPKNSHNVPKTKPKTQTLTLTEDNNYSTSPPRDASDDDSSSHVGNVFRQISLNSIRKSEVRELKRKLATELDQVRGFIKKLQAKEQEQEKEKPNHDQRRTVPNAPNPNNVKKKMKKVKSNGGSVVELDWHSSPVFKTCSDLLTKLMKHKFGWVFNKPVDVKGLGLHDYHTIVKHPMDLGTVKTRLDKNWYKS